MFKFQFDSFTDFLAMGGYASYVWVVYGLFTFFVIFNIASPLLTKRRIVSQLRSRLEREDNQ